VPKTLESVLEQTYKNLEIIIVDDGSTDKTKDMLKSFSDQGQIIYIFQENQGLPSARNTGIKNSSGKYISVLDDDDLWFPFSAERMAKELDDNPDYGMVYSDAVLIDEHGRRLNQNARRHYPSGDIYEEITSGRVVCLMGAIMVRREVIHDVGMFDPELKRYEDLDFTRKITEKYKVRFISTPLLMYRKHTNSMTSQQKYKVDLIALRYRRVFESQRFRDASPHFQADIFSKYHIQLGKGYLGMSEYKLARKNFLKSLSYAPKRLVTYRLLARSVLGKLAGRCPNKRIIV